VLDAQAPLLAPQNLPGTAGCLKISPLSTSSPMKTFQCVVCGFVYDEAQGRPEDGIAPGTLWADVPDTWECPDCGVGKSDFEMIEI
jgi:rubredoxin